MEFEWVIHKQDIDRLTDFVNAQKGNSFVKNRVRRNLSDDIPQFSKDEFWKWMVACLLTTQQRSGPNSSITRFLMTSPFPLCVLDT
jgi:N-glycosylase/DNA lyase